MVKMNQYVHLWPHYLVVEILTPLYEYNNVSTVRINKSIVDRAIRNFVQLVVRTPKGERVFFPKAVKKDGKKVQEVFLFPDNPMKMYELEIPHSKVKPIEAYQF